MTFIENNILIEVIKEYVAATKKFTRFNSAHEGYAVILEELDELKEQVWKNQTKRDSAQMKKEAIQVAAMAIRFIHDICICQKGKK